MNVEWVSSLPAWVRRRMYFGLQRGIGSKIGSIWREFLEWERLSPAELNARAEQKLLTLLEDATAHTEYYRQLKLARRASESGFDWLRRFPPLTRMQVRDRFTSLVRDNFREEIKSPDSVSARRYDWLVVKTGGSTGVPTTVVHDARARDWGRATRLYAARQCGFSLGTRYFRLWGSELDLLNQQANLQQRLLRNILAELPMNAFRAKEADLKRHLEAMLSRPDIHHLMTYVDAAASLAEFARERNLELPKLQTIMACAGTVTPEFRRILQEGFQAEVFDKYGSRECCDMACECASHTGLHVLSPNVYLEIVDEESRPVPPGKTGRVLVTLLNNASFPMVRYEIGDVATWAEEKTPCPCGSPFPRIASLQGRQDDMLVTEDGTLQSSAFVRHFVGVSLNRQIIREWQLEQSGPRSFVFRYRPEREEGLAENLARLKESFLLVFGRSAQIEMRRVEEIPPSPSGKVRWIINSYRRRPAPEQAPAAPAR